VNRRPRIAAVRATEDHAESLAAFYRATWDESATADSVLVALHRAAAANRSTPGEPPPAAIVLEGSRVIGYCGSLPHRIWDGATEHTGYWVKGLMVLPEFRNGPVGYLAVKELTQHLPRAIILTVAPAARRLFTALGYTDLGAVTNWVKPLRPYVVAKQADLTAIDGLIPGWASRGVRVAQRTGVASLLAGSAGLVMSAMATATRLPSAGLRTSQGVPAKRELDELWQTARATVHASPVRDGEYLMSRFTGAAGHVEADRYLFVNARDGARLVGVAVVRKPRATSDIRLGAMKMATVSDILFAPERSAAGLATLGAIERCARATEAHALTCMSSHSSLTRLLKRQGYLRLGGNVHFFFRDVTGNSRWPTDLTSWWLGRGDGESDATF